MRVIAGKFKGQHLKMPKGVNIRPSSQKVKEALFSILGEGIQGSSFLELFAGSGNIGIEALSRGAKKVFFIENNYRCIRAIEENLKHLGIGYSYELDNPQVEKGVSAVLLHLNGEKAIELLNQKKQRFDFVFLDPPYYQDELKNCLIKIFHYDILNPRALVIAEYNRRQTLSYLAGGLKVMITKRYGDTLLSFYHKGDKQ